MKTELHTKFSLRNLKQFEQIFFKDDFGDSMMFERIGDSKIRVVSLYYNSKETIFMESFYEEGNPLHSILTMHESKINISFEKISKEEFKMIFNKAKIKF
ncbi:hypothetical protein MYP_693 [Sporocytophaga myxococcoides]|uniref:Uncharacterized protein n=1 Tax=Sporocytophaga myxococcoides TaxID=153721 RepID=A0A098L992_9BACT|nr:hypothetical protein [Sporocytophaga myxococcoides]GAL83466.1 hypothetical protein MYP_693 [Sporocytophaga myxococcoides]